MSIKPMACADNGVLNWYADSKTTEQIDLYVIPDTHRVVPVELLKLAESLFRAESLRIVRGGDWELPMEKATEIRAIIEDKENKQ